MLAVFLTAGATFFLANSENTRNIGYALALFSLISWVASGAALFMMSMVGAMIGVFARKALTDVKAEATVKDRAKAWAGGRNA